MWHVTHDTWNMTAVTAVIAVSAVSTVPWIIYKFLINFLSFPCCLIFLSKLIRLIGLPDFLDQDWSGWECKPDLPEQDWSGWERILCLPEHDWSGCEGMPDLPEQDYLILLRQIRHTSKPDKSSSGISTNHANKGNSWYVLVRMTLWENPFWPPKLILAPISPKGASFFTGALQV